ncbi:MAG: FAD-dependent oxidoreductase [Ktedonobacteraceae bacterium]|nr:FAD-dependent oxidoreductase [Ktedonobacteraceae bacterium]
MVVGDVTTAVDVLVIGAGPAGYVAAIRAAQLGRHVTLIEADTIGGTCLRRGCIPLKALLSASQHYQQMKRDDLTMMGIHAESVSFDWGSMQTWKQGVVERLVEGVRRLIAGNRVTLLKGNAWFINAEEMRVEGEESSHRLKFEHCVLATGASAVSLPDLTYDGEQILTPEQSLQLSKLPAALSIFGNDYIALELATLFARLGVSVKLFSPGEQLLADIEPSALRLVQAGLRKLGIHITTNVALSTIAERPIVILNGVRPNTKGLHLGEADIKVTEYGGIIVNSMQQSSVPHVYAIGDCTGNNALASVAIRQGKIAAEALCGQRVQFAPLVIPQVVHTTPELATAGLSVEAATHTGYNTITGRFPLAANGRALTLGTEAGVALIVARQEDEAVLGATLVGPHAGDLIGQVVLAIEMGATLTDLSEIIYAHPGLNEIVQESAEAALGRAIHILR